MIKCEKCGKKIEGAVVVRDFSYYHFECGKKPLKDRVADAMMGDMKIRGDGENYENHKSI